MGLFNLSRRNGRSLSHKLIALAFAVVVSITAFTQPAGAVTKIDAMTPDTAAQAFIYYKALRTCLTNTFMRNSVPQIRLVPPYVVIDDKGTMSKDDAVNYDWFYGGAMQGTTYNPFTYNVTDFGVYPENALSNESQCTSDTGGKKAFKLLAEYTGYKSGPEFLCAIGFERQINNTPNQCAEIGGNNDFIRPDDPGKEIDDWWKNVIGAGTGTSSLGAGEYELLYQSFIAGCKVVPGTQGEITYKIRVVQNNKLVLQSYYANDRDVNKGTAIRIYSGTTMTCGELENALNDLSDRAVQAVIDHIGEIGTYDPGDDGEDDPNNTSTTCAVDGVGWIICPVITFAAGLADSMFTILSDNFLKVGVSVVNTDPSAGPTTTYNAWRAMQGVANVILVIIFLIIIFSQLTSAGISNYGVKKMLPRLIVAAIIINLSFTLCQVAVDVSNILGYSLKDFFTGLAVEAGSGNAGAYDTTTNNVLGGTNPWFNLAGEILAVAAIATAGYFMLSMLGTVLLAVLVALIMILLILVARQAIIVLAIITAPVAIALWLLPNTQSVAKQWWKIFSRMLLLFPIIALIFGGSTLASVILRDSFGSVVEGNDNVNWLGQIIAAGIQIIPLFATPLVLKGALSAVPLVGNLASKLSSRANSGIGRKAKESYQSSIMGQIRMNRKRGSEEFRNQRTARRIQDGGLAGVVAGGLAITKEQKAQRDAVRNAARATLAGAESKELTHAREALNKELSAVAPENRDSHLEALAVDQSRTEADRSAAMHQLAAMGRDGSIRRLMAPGSGADQESLRRAVDANVGALSGKAPDLVKGKKAAFKSVKGEELAGFSEDTATEYMAHLATLTNPAEIDAAVEGFNAAVKDISLTPELQGRFSALAGKRIIAGYAGLPPAIASRLVAGFGPDGKIR
jgi:hypothetical protein